METSDLEDEYNFDEYSLKEYEWHRGPPLIKTTSRLIAAVTNNQVEVLRDLLDSPKWYNVLDAQGFNLLEMAIIAKSEEAFGFMTSLPGLVAHCGEQALATALVGSYEYPEPTEEWFACELITRGVNVNVAFGGRNNALHVAIERRFVGVSLLLIERGVDVNKLGDRGVPFELVFHFLNEHVFEVVGALLEHGAEPSFDFFQLSVLQNTSMEVQEMLFLYTFDSFSQFKTDFEVILRLAHNQFWMFDEILKHPVDVEVRSDSTFRYFYFLCSMRVRYLKRIVERFGSLLREVFRTGIFSQLQPWGFHWTFSLDNLNFLVENSFITSNFIVEMSTYDFIDNTLHYHNFDGHIMHLTHLYCFLLSYGGAIDERDLQVVYQNFGFCDLFKILLHMDHQKCYIYNCYVNMKLMPQLIYDPTMSLKRLLQKPVASSNYRYVWESRLELLHYFADRRLWMDLQYYNSGGAYLEIKKEDLPQLPSLVELSRNTFREYFIRKFNIRTSKKLLNLLDCLPISHVHKKIISYETKLYGFHAECKDLD